MICFKCGQPVDVEDSFCGSCGANLVLAVGPGTSYLAYSPPLATPSMVAPELLVPRLGEILIERGVLSNDQLQVALEQHQKIVASGQPKLIGQLLLEMGLINREILDQVVTEQILKLQQALYRTNQILEQRVQERTFDLKLALSKLAELNELKTNFVSNISHELRTPLTHIKGYLSLFTEQAFGPLTKDQLDALKVVVKAESQLEQLIEDLIQFSLVARGQMTLNLSQVKASDLVLNAVKKAEKQINDCKIDLKVAVEEGLPDFPVDQDKVTWVLMELLENAGKFSPQGGRVTVSALLENELITFSVEDNGIGITPEGLREIFEPFHQLDGSTTRHFGGMGLGLALAKRIVEAHAGIFKVSSEVGKGSCFKFSLPTRQAGKIG